MGFLSRCPTLRHLSAWMLIQALCFSQIITPFANAQPNTLRVGQRKEAGFEELQNQLAPRTSVGLEEWVGEIDPENWKKLTDPKTAPVQSPSGIRAIVDKPIPLPVQVPLADTDLSDEHKLFFARYGYLFAINQMEKKPRQKTFWFVLGRDPRPSGLAIREAHIRGILAAAKERGVQVRFLDAGILPTPFIESLVRLKGADGAVIGTASHNPLEWNGAKYTTAAHEPRGAAFEGGALLPWAEMEGIIAQVKAWVAKGTASTDPFIRQLNEWEPADIEKAVEEVSIDELRPHLLSESRKMWGLERESDFEDFRGRAGRVRMVVDSNGGAAAGIYAWFLKEMGFTVAEINGLVGRPQHLIEPVHRSKEKNALADAGRELRRLYEIDQAEGNEYQAYIAIVTDFDSDRATWVMLDAETGKVIEPNPQEITAFNVAMTLAREQWRPSGDPKLPLAIVVHSATSRRIWEIANAFGAEVFVADVGEVNVLERMRRLERGEDPERPGRKYRVLGGVEAANAGAIFRGEDGDFLGDTCRNGAHTGFFTGMVAVTPEIGREWLEARNRELGSREPIPVEPTLVQLLESLPGERSQGRWRFATPIRIEGGPGDVPEALIVPLKSSLERLWKERIWSSVNGQGEGLILPNGRRERFSDYRILHYDGARPSLTPTRGGWLLQLTTADGRQDFIWLRVSATEGMLRVETEGQGENAPEIAQALHDLFKSKWYPPALAAAKASTGLEEIHKLLDKLPGLDYLFQWDAVFEEFASSAVNYPGAFEQDAIRVFHQDREAPHEIRLFLPKGIMVEPKHEPFLTRYLAARLNNLVWEAGYARGPVTKIVVASRFGRDVERVIGSTDLLPQLQTYFLGSSVEQVDVVDPLPVGDPAPPISPPLGNETQILPLSDIQGWVVGFDVGGADMKVVIIHDGKIAGSVLVKNWPRAWSSNSARGISIGQFFDRQLDLAVRNVVIARPADLAEVTRAIQGTGVIGMSWSGGFQKGRPVQGSRVVLTSTDERVLEKWLQDHNVVAIGDTDALGMGAASLGLRDGEAIGMGSGVAQNSVDAQGKIRLHLGSHRGIAGRMVLRMNEDAPVHASTGIHGAVQQLLGDSGFVRAAGRVDFPGISPRDALNLQKAANQGQADAPKAVDLVGRDLAAYARSRELASGTKLLWVVGGNAQSRLLGAARKALEKFSEPGQPPVAIRLELPQSPKGKNSLGKQTQRYVSAIGAGVWAYLRMKSSVGLEEGLRLTPEQLMPRFDRMLERVIEHPRTELLLDIDGVAADRSAPITPEMARTIHGFHEGALYRQELFLTSRTLQEVKERTKDYPEGLKPPGSVDVSGAALTKHYLPEELPGLIRDWIKERSIPLRGKGELAVPRVSTGQIGGIVIQMDEAWFAKEVEQLGRDPRSDWADEIRERARPLIESKNSPHHAAFLLSTLTPSGRASIDWLSPKPEALAAWAGDHRVDWSDTVFVDDQRSSLVGFLEIVPRENLKEWPGLLLCLDRHDPNLPDWILQIAQPGESKPANGPEITEIFVRILTAAMNMRLDSEGLTRLREEARQHGKTAAQLLLETPTTPVALERMIRLNRIVRSRQVPGEETGTVSEHVIIVTPQAVREGLLASLLLFESPLQVDVLLNRSQMARVKQVLERLKINTNSWRLVNSEELSESDEDLAASLHQEEVEKSDRGKDRTLITVSSIDDLESLGEELGLSEQQRKRLTDSRELAHRSLFLWTGSIVPAKKGASGLEEKTEPEAVETGWMRRDETFAGVRDLFMTGLEEHDLDVPLEQAVPLGDVEVVYPKGKTPNFSENTTFITLLAGEASRWRASIEKEWAQLPSEEQGAFTRQYAVLDASGQPVLEGGNPVWRSKVTVLLDGQPAGARLLQAALSLGWNAITVIGHQRAWVQTVMDQATGAQLTHVVQEKTTGGTAAAFRLPAAIEGLRNSKKLVVATVGDQILYDRGLLRLAALTWSNARAKIDEEQPLLVLGTACVAEPGSRGRVIRNAQGDIVYVLEAKDWGEIQQEKRKIPDELDKAGFGTVEALQEAMKTQEISVSIYVAPAKQFFEALGSANRNNAQEQFYATHIVAAMVAAGGHVVSVDVPEWQTAELTEFKDLAQTEALLRGHADELRWGAAGLEERVSPIERLHRQLFSVREGEIGKYREAMAVLAREVEPGHPINEETFFFVRIGGNLHLGDPQGSITTALFNHIFRELGLNVVMVPVDFDYVGGKEWEREGHYNDLVSLILEDKKTIGFAAGHPMKQATPKAVEAWAQGRVDPDDLRKVLSQIARGGILKTNIPNDLQSRKALSQSFSMPHGLIAVHENKLAVTSLMTSGEAEVRAIERQFLRETLETQEETDFIVLGASGATGEEIARALARRPYIRKLYLVEHPSKAAELKRITQALLTEAMGRDITAFLSTRDEEVLRQHQLRGLDDLDQVVGSVRFVVDATPGANPIRPGGLEGIGKDHKVFTLTYRPDLYQGLRYAAGQGADTRNGVNLLITDNLLQIRGILIALGVSAQEADRLSQELIEPKIVEFLEARGLEPKRLTEEIETETALRNALQEKLHHPGLPEEMVPGHLIELLEGTRQSDRPTLAVLVREKETVIGFLDSEGNPFQGTGLVRFSTPEAGPERFFPELLRIARERLLEPSGQELDGIAVAIVGKVNPDGSLRPTRLGNLDGVNVVELLQEAARGEGIQGPIAVVNDSQGASRGAEAPPLTSTLYFVLRPGGLGATLWDGKRRENLEPGISSFIETPTGQKTLEEVATPLVIDEGQMAQMVKPLAEAMIELAQKHGVRRIVAMGELANSRVYERSLKRALRESNVPVALEVAQDDEITYLRGAQRFLQTDAQALLEALSTVATGAENPAQLRSAALRILREVLRSKVLVGLRQSGGRFADHVRQAVLKEAQRITQHPSQQDPALLQQAAFTLGALGNISDRQRLFDLEGSDVSEKIGRAARFAREDLEFRLKQGAQVVSLVLRQRSLTASFLRSGVVQGAPKRRVLSGGESFEDLLNMIGRMVLELANEHNLGFHEIDGVGMASSAELDESSQFVLRSFYHPAAFPSGESPRNLKQALEEKLQQLAEGHSIPVVLINDEEAVAIAEARHRGTEGIYLHIGTEARLWHLKDGQSSPLIIPQEMREDLSGWDLAQRAQELIRRMASDRRVDIETLVGQEQRVRILLDMVPVPGISGPTYEDKLSRLSATELGKVLQAGSYSQEAASFSEPLFRNLAERIAAVIAHLREEVLTNKTDNVDVILGGGVVYKNRFVIEELVPEALESRRVSSVTLILQQTHPTTDQALIPQVLASYVSQQLGFPATGLEERVGLPAQVAGNLVILTPEMAQRAVLNGFAQLNPTPLLAVIVADDAQEIQVATGLEETGFTLAMPMVNLAQTKWTLAEAIVDIQVRAWAKGLETFVLNTLGELRALGKYLQIPEISFRSWVERFKRSTVEVAA